MKFKVKTVCGILAAVGAFAAKLYEGFTMTGTGAANEPVVVVVSALLAAAVALSVVELLFRLAGKRK